MVFKKKVKVIFNVEKPTRLICSLISHIINFSYLFVDSRSMCSSEGHKQESKHLVLCLSFVSRIKPRALPGKQRATESPGQDFTSMPT